MRPRDARRVSWCSLVAASAAGLLWLGHETASSVPVAPASLPVRAAPARATAALTHDAMADAAHAAQPRAQIATDAGARDTRGAADQESIAVAPPAPPVDPRDPSTLVKRWAEEQRDEAASRSLRQFLEAFLAETLPPDLLREVDCRDTVCRLQILNVEGGMAIATGIPEVLGGETFTYPSEDEEGPLHTYLSRQDLSARMEANEAAEIPGEPWWQQRAALHADPSTRAR